MRIPTVGELIQLGTEQAEALMALPMTAVELNNALISLTKSVNKLNQMVERLDNFSEALEPVMNEEFISQLPVLMTMIQQSAIPAMQMVMQTHAQLGAIAGSLERLTKVMDDSFRAVLELPGMGLVNKIRLGMTPPRSTEKVDEVTGAQG